jgi:aminodeoxyfutalosine deaminase
MSTATDDFVRRLPKVEQHLHLEGSLRLPTIERLARRHGIDVGDRRYLEQRYQFSGFEEFLMLFMLGLDVIRTGEDFADVTEALAVELAGQNVRYAEVTTTAYSHVQRGIAVEEYRAGLAEGRRRARELHGVEIAWVVDIPREFEPADARFTAAFLAGPHAPEGVVAIGLGGPEFGSDPRKYADSFAIARAEGLGSVPHAGEMDGADSVWGAVDALHADRIGHGIRAIESDGLVRRLTERAIPLEISLSSNVLLGACASLADHAVGELLQRGVIVTFNTDDPGYFSTTLTDELLLARDLLDLDAGALRGLQVIAVETSFAPPEMKRRIRAEIEEFSGS